MKETFPYDMKEVTQLAEERGISIPHAKRIIYQRAKDKTYYLAHRQERIEYFKEYRKLVSHLRRKNG